MSLDLWIGLECTHNRVGDHFFSQCVKNGHYERLEDLKKFSELGAKKIRYPCLWEEASPKEGVYNWVSLDQRLLCLRQLGLDPIAGLLHHGSGPAYTDLLDPEFPVKFAAYARAFAIHYPWICDYVPIDEMLTTARFSCLYGYWYPHQKSDTAFVRALFHQVQGTILAMQAIREINPAARLIQVEDLGRAQSTAPLEHQCRFENDRRWLSMDLMFGRVTATHPLYSYLRHSGLSEAELIWLRNHSCTPDILGLNHYLLSNRFLDHRLEFYPPCYHGGNNSDCYADVGAIDSGQALVIPPEDIFKEAWDRYKIPLAVTEVHLRGHRESQMRWFYQVWCAAEKLRQQRVDIRAVTAWSLLGNYDWHNLCVMNDNFYEPGVFDLRNPFHQPQDTGLSQMLKEITAGIRPTHPVLEQAGWWQNRRHLLYASENLATPPMKPSPKPLAITGGSGTLGRAFARVCEKRDISYVLLQRADLDIANNHQVQEVLTTLNPWAVINAAGYVKVDQAEVENERCFRENTEGPTLLAEFCAKKKIPFMTFSSDLVFDGDQETPYLETHPVGPLNTYGRSKVESEDLVLSAWPESLVIRTSAFFGPWDRFNFATNVLRHLQQYTSFSAVGDIFLSPTYVPDLANASLDLLVDGESGVLHLANEGTVSWAEFAKMLATEARFLNLSLDTSLIIEKKMKDMDFKARRPRNSVLSSERFKILPPLESAINRYFSELEIALL